MPDQMPPEAGAQTPHEVLNVSTTTRAVTAVANDVVCQPERGSTLHAPSAATSVGALVHTEQRSPSCC